ncbi:MAG TPA: precorrin-2 C(20)-methyltransferase [Desulfonatronum sp.]|nr:precorrin-2 C(20)-methyltransferase [Desulfonatronum sp.]
MNPGILYGIGVGPGDPDLLTLAAAKALASVDAVFAPASTKNDFSLALDIIRPHLRDRVDLRRLDFPMTRDDAVRRLARLENARLIMDYLATGSNAAFITLGDPLVYSTFGHLLRGLRALNPTVDVRIIPGITSFQAASARLGEVLVEGDECLVVATGNTDPAKLKALLEIADAAIVLKPAKRLGGLKSMLEKLGRARDTRLVVRCGLPGEKIASLDQMAESISYFSLLHVGRRKELEVAGPPNEPGEGSRE